MIWATNCARAAENSSNSAAGTMGAGRSGGSCALSRGLGGRNAALRLAGHAELHLAHALHFDFAGADHGFLLALEEIRIDVEDALGHVHGDALQRRREHGEAFLLVF